MEADKEKIQEAVKILDEQAVPEDDRMFLLPEDKTENDMVREFHEVMEQRVDQGISKTKEEMHLFNFRFALINEEFKETAEAAKALWDTVNKGNNIPAYKEAKAHLLKELMDMKYVIEGFCVTYGWDSDTAFKRVHESNMSKLTLVDGKLKVVKDENGKVQKNPDYQPPVLLDLTNDEGEDYEAKANETLDSIQDESREGNNESKQPE